MNISVASGWDKICVGIICLILTLQSCESGNLVVDNPSDSIDLSGFPSFITPTEAYFKINIPGNHSIDGAAYQLKVSGALERPAEFSLHWLPRECPIISV